jgi:hypothetical protein
MKRIALLFALVFGLSASAQNIALHAIGYGSANSRTGTLAEAHVNLINNGTTTNSYIVKRTQVGTTGLVDSNYFCWDLCYPTWVNQSQGTVDIAPGSVAYDFSGYAYVLDTSANGQDTIWYTFENIADSTDAITVPVLFVFSTTFGQNELPSPAAKIYPNPSNTGRVTLEFAASSEAARVEVLDVLGKVQQVIEIPAFATEAVWLSEDAPKGVYLLRKRSGAQVENLGKVLIH